MSQFQGPFTMAPVGSTSNNTHTGVRVDADSDFINCLFKIEAVGATPTVTAQVQASMDSTNGTDGNWYDLSTIPSDTPTEALTNVRTAVGVYGNFIAIHKFGGWLRFKTTLNTNVTYSALLYTQDED